MKIHLVCAGGPEFFNAGEEALNAYFALACARPDTELVARPLRAGLNDLEQYDYAYFQLLNAREACEGVLRAEKEGADAAIVYCFFDPGMRDARGVAQIPVVGLAESSMIFASMMGRRFAIVVPRPGQIPIEEDNLVLYKMRSLAIENKPIRSLHTKMSLTAETMFGDIDTDGVVADFKKVAGSCIEDGAEVLIPGCSALSLMLALSGVKEVDGAPIVDPLVSAVKLAEAMVDLNQGGRPWISRSLLYKRPAEDDVQQVRKMFGLGWSDP